LLALDRPAFEALADEFDAAVRGTPEIDHFCSSSAWAFSADRTLMPPRTLFARRSDAGWVALARVDYSGGRQTVEPLEAAWCLSCPLAYVGDPRRLAAELVAELAEGAPSAVVFLGGLVQTSSLFGMLVSELAPRYRFATRVVPPTRRFRASLAGGVDGFLSRRSSTFRAGLRDAVRKATAGGVAFEEVTVRDEGDVATLFARLLAIETRSWKGLAGDGLTIPSMRAFYAEMLPRLGRAGAIRAHVGTRAGEDVAIIVGGVTDTPEGLVYRGLQFSFDDAYRSLSLGNLAQLAQITALAEEAVAIYDLGSEVDYKRRWGEQCFETVTLVAAPK